VEQEFICYNTKQALHQKDEWVCFEVGHEMHNKEGSLLADRDCFGMWPWLL
jgi:hypothetical protein